MRGNIMTDLGGVFTAIGTLLNDTGSSHAPGSSGGSGSGSLSGGSSSGSGSLSSMTGSLSG